MEIETDKRISLSYLVRVWKENPTAPWQFWVKELTNDKQYAFSSPDAFHESIDSELFNQNQDDKKI